MSDDSESTWWKTMGIGLLIVGATVFLYFFFTDLETTGEARRIHWLIALMYNIGGKWVTCSVVGMLGIVVTWFGYKQWQES